MFPSHDQIVVQPEPEAEVTTKSSSSPADRVVSPPSEVSSASPPLGFMSEPFTSAGEPSSICKSKATLPSDSAQISVSKKSLAVLLDQMLGISSSATTSSIPIHFVSAWSASAISACVIVSSPISEVVTVAQVRVSAIVLTN